MPKPRIVDFYDKCKLLSLSSIFSDNFADGGILDANELYDKYKIFSLSLIANDTDADRDILESYFPSGGGAMPKPQIDELYDKCRIFSFSFSFFLFSFRGHFSI